MISNPTLATLEGGDWSQRYRNSLIDYNGGFRYVHDIAASGGAVIATLGSPIKGKEVVEINHKLVNVERPKAGWVDLPVGREGKGNFPALLYYADVKQYSRGYNDSNTLIEFLGLRGESRIEGTVFDWMLGALTRLQNPTVIGSSSMSNSDVWDVLQDGNSGGKTINRLMAIGSTNSNGDRNVLMYRRRKIGRFTADSLLLESSIYEQEVKEMLPRIRYKITGPVEGKERPRFEPKRRQPQATARPVFRTEARADTAGIITGLDYTTFTDEQIAEFASFTRAEVDAIGSMQRSTGITQTQAIQIANRERQQERIRRSVVGRQAEIDATIRAAGNRTREEVVNTLDWGPVNTAARQRVFTATTDAPVLPLRGFEDVARAQPARRNTMFTTAGLNLPAEEDWSMREENMNDEN